VDVGSIALGAWIARIVLPILVGQALIEGNVFAVLGRDIRLNRLH
jgi:hypothetical protein